MFAKSFVLIGFAKNIAPHLAREHLNWFNYATEIAHPLCEH
jgi:hypothetical protein